MLLVIGVGFLFWFDLEGARTWKTTIPIESSNEEGIVAGAGLT